MTMTYYDYSTPYYTNYSYGPNQTQPFLAPRHQVVYYCGINDLHFGAQVEAQPRGSRGRWEKSPEDGGKSWELDGNMKM